jgi:tetratricopeptide (TPR) repeat protein
LWNACNSLVEANQLGPDEYDPYLALSDVETVQEDFQSAVGYAMQGVYLAEKGKGGTVEVYSRLVRVYFFAGAVNFKNGEAIKDEADKLKEHGGGKEAVGALLQESEEEYENSRRNLLRSIDSYDRTLGLSPHEYEKDDEFVIATEYYYAAHKLLGFYYLDRNQLQLAQMYFEKWAGHMFAHPTKEDIDVAEQFFAVWRDKTIKGTMKQQTQQGQP